MPRYKMGLLCGDKIGAKDSLRSKPAFLTDGFNGYDQGSAGKVY
jgi:hypothetical protein